MANELTLRIMKNLSDRMCKGAKPAPAVKTSYASAAKVSSSAKSLSLDSYTSSLGASKSASDSGSKASSVSSPVKASSSDYETAIKSLINKGSQAVANESNDSKTSTNSASNSAPKSGRVGFDDLIKTLGR